MVNQPKSIIRTILHKQKIRKVAALFLVVPSWVVIVFSGVFDKSWYHGQYHSGRAMGLKNKAPLLHYLVIGRMRGLTPSPFFVGEYFDPIRWQLSMLDPLVKYLLRPSTWVRPTSLLFDPTVVDLQNGKMPPLVKYLRSKHKTIALDAKLKSPDTPSLTKILKATQDAVDTRFSELSVHAVAQPVNSFDKKQEAEYIQGFAQSTLPKNENAKHPLVSIIMPAWNREKLIGKAIESVQRQSMKDWELIIVDDGSTDKTVETVKGYSNKDKRVIILTPGHGGVCKARNHGLRAAKGIWYAFLDSDNEWTPDFLQTSIGALQENDYKASYTAIAMENNGQIRYRITEPDPTLLQNGNYIDLNSLIVHRTIANKIGLFDENLRRMVDYDLVCRIGRVTDFLYVPIIGVAYTDEEDLVRISTTESVSWDGVVKSKNFIDWDSIHKNRSSKLTSIILPVRGGAHHAIRCLNSIWTTCENRTDIEILIVDASSNSATNTTLGAMPALDSRVIYYRQPASRDVVLASNYGIAKSKGKRIVIVNQHCIVEDGWLDELVDGLDGKSMSIQGPLHLKPNRTILSAGVEFHGKNALPVNILEDHPLSDAAKLADTYEVQALANGCVAMSIATAQSLRGLNPLYDGGFEIQDLCLRAAAMDSKISITVKKKSHITNPDGGRGWYTKGQKQYLTDWAGKVISRTSPLWGTAGFKVTEYRKDDVAHEDESRVRPVLAIKKSVTPYRWAIKIAAPPDERRFVWGDLYYAQSLAKALEKLGQTVAIDFLGGHDRPTGYLDDVNLDLRGLTPFNPKKGKINLLWVISHPDDVTAEMVQSFDMVYSAGKPWAEYISELSGQQVEFLPQCTDTTIFHPEAVEPEYKDRILFVGSSRNVARPIVLDSIQAGIDISVYGGGWESLIEKRYLKKTFIPNSVLGKAYGSAKVVLNDHWQDMRDWGFISNRIFDALATGASVITDEVKGLYDTIPSDQMIKTYTKSEDLKQLIESDWLSNITKEDRKRSARYINDYHSFDARANKLLKDVQTISRSRERS